MHAWCSVVRCRPVFLPKGTAEEPTVYTVQHLRGCVVLDPAHLPFDTNTRADIHAGDTFLHAHMVEESSTGRLEREF